MPSYVARVELYQATREDQDQLNESMRQHGFERVLIHSDDARCHLATTTTFIGDAVTIEEAFRSVQTAARSAFIGLSTGTFFNVACSEILPN